MSSRRIPRVPQRHFSCKAIADFRKRCGLVWVPSADRETLSACFPNNPQDQTAKRKTAFPCLVKNSFVQSRPSCKRPTKATAAVGAIASLCTTPCPADPADPASARTCVHEKRASRHSAAWEAIILRPRVQKEKSAAFPVFTCMPSCIPPHTMAPALEPGGS